MRFIGYFISIWAPDVFGMIQRFGKGSIRLPTFPYTVRATYFITICTFERRPLFGHLEPGRMILSPAGKVVEEEWLRSPEIRSYLYLDSHIIMPNHFHGIVSWTKTTHPPGRRPIRHRSDGIPIRPPDSLGSFIARFKASATKRIRQQNPSVGRVWQRGYYEHIVRDRQALTAIRSYIQSDPIRSTRPR
jgi:REP element-mobilizing transposase RayT